MKSRRTPLHSAGYLLLAVGALLGVHQSLAHLGLAPSFPGLTWSHVHFVTIGALTVTFFGTVQETLADELGSPRPSKKSYGLLLAALLAGFGMIWLGRSTGQIPVFRAGAATYIGLAALLSASGARAAHRSDEPLKPQALLLLVAPLLLAVGATYGYGLLGDLYGVPGGWPGLREAHIHANTWGWAGFVVVGTILSEFPRLLGTEMHSERMAEASFWLLFLGIWPMVIGPLLGMRLAVTGPGLILYAAGYVLYLYNLYATYRKGNGGNDALLILVSQFWIVAPMTFVPVAILGAGAEVAYAEGAAFHFLYLGWALPVLLFELKKVSASGKPVAFRWAIVAWNASVALSGLAFFYGDADWGRALFAAGFGSASAIWLYFLWRQAPWKATSP